MTHVGVAGGVAGVAVGEAEAAPHRPWKRRGVDEVAFQGDQAPWEVQQPRKKRAGEP